MSRNIFNSIALKKPKSNVFDLSHDVKLSFNMGDLVPVCVMEAVPGDKFNISAETLVRMAPLVAPVMHRIDLSIHYFYVPNRLLWDNWADWISNYQDDNSLISAPYAYMNNATYTGHKVFDYLGLPFIDAANGAYAFNPLAAAAYQCIYNDYYRDQNMIGEVDFKLVDGDNTAALSGALGILRKRAWEHDYFTSALPFAQKGAPVAIPLGDVTLKDDWLDSGLPKFVAADGATVPGGDVVSDAAGSIGVPVGSPTAQPVALDPDGTLEVAATTINELRRAFRLQEWLEKNARAGTRYVESILAHFGVKSSDARLQRPEYITGVKSPIVISEVLNTTGEDGGLPQGNMAGHGIGVVNGKFGSYFCEEHGYIIGIMSAMPKTAYQQGVPKHFLKRDQFDYFWPEFANIGEQPVSSRELNVDQIGDNANWGYVPRYAEYKFMPSRVAGDFKTNLDFWHLGRIFTGGCPPLSQSFIECNPSTRIFAVEDGTDTLYAHILNKVSAVRRMPKFGTPSF